MYCVSKNKNYSSSRNKNYSRHVNANIKMPVTGHIPMSEHLHKTLFVYVTIVLILNVFQIIFKYTIKIIL